MKVLTICNYGQVRSVTMRNVLRSCGHLSVSVGMMNNPPWVVDALIEHCDLAIVCNKPNVENRLQPDIPMEYVDAALIPLEKHKDKIVICDTIGLDKWGKPNHPDLLPICEEFVRKLEDQGLLTK